jgi:uncharacterized membrane protein YkvA (DUF1232 family)
MVTSSDYTDPAARQLPAVVERNSRIVEQDFWRKLLKLIGRIPFAEEAAAAYFCAIDPMTPGRVKGILIGALAYFVVPLDAIPDFVAGFGYTDDAAVLAAAIGLVSGHMRDRHYRRARAALGIPEPDFN